MKAQSTLARSRWPECLDHWDASVPPSDGCSVHEQEPLRDSIEPDGVWLR